MSDAAPPGILPRLERMAQQIHFVLEIDRLKSVLRRTYILEGSRNENSAEHSWHLAMMALVLAEHSNEEISLQRVFEMLLIHDIVEIDAGDTYAYDEVANAGKREREERAAARLFGLLPDDLSKRLLERWEEFEAARTPEARFANALDRMQPMLHNYFTNGKAWLEHGVLKSQVIERNGCINDGSTELWSYIEQVIEDAVDRGLLKP